MNNNISEFFNNILDPFIVLIVLIVLLLLNSWIFKKIKSISSEGNIIKNSIAFFFILFGSLIFILSLPVENSIKGQILTFFGIIVSAGIALSSTTILGNIIAGIMNSSMERFRNGDLIKIGEMQGRVTKKSIFHTEIQLEDSNFITIPNLYIASHPVKLTRKTNTVISTSVSLGYDVSRTRIEEALKEAAISAGLTDPYVYIISLGDYSVVYRIHGFLEDSSKFFSTNSSLNGQVMDMLHEYGIEIVSPSFMNQRRVDEKHFIPENETENQSDKNEVSPEELIFDEAIKSEEIEKKKDFIEKLEEKKKSLREDYKESENDENKKTLKSETERIDKLIERIKANILEQKENDKNPET